MRTEELNDRYDQAQRGRGTVAFGLPSIKEDGVAVALGGAAGVLAHRSLSPGMGGHHENRGGRRDRYSAYEPCKRPRIRAVVVMARDQGILPLDERGADAADEAKLDDICETERRLLYVACTRAREHLLLTGGTPASEYLADFMP